MVSAIFLKISQCSASALAGLNALRQRQYAGQNGAGGLAGKAMLRQGRAGKNH
jgi:hypothetical protein